MEEVVEFTFDLSNLEEGDHQIYKTQIKDYKLYMRYSYTHRGQQFIGKRDIYSIRIDELGEYTGSGHAVSGPRNRTINLFTKFGHQNTKLKLAENNIKIKLEPTLLVINAVQVNDINFHKKSELNISYNTQDFVQLDTIDV
jgi:hypothetical protein